MKPFSTHSNNMIYEETFNLLYIIKNYTPSFSKSKGSFLSNAPKEQSYSNIIIWNIAQQQQSTVLNPIIAQQCTVSKLIFEQQYDETKQSMLFAGSPNLLNNNLNSPRPPKNKLLLECYSMIDKKNYLWTCDKTGKNLTELTSFEGTTTNWHIDIGNSCLRLLKHSNTGVIITELDW